MKRSETLGNKSDNLTSPAGAQENTHNREPDGFPSRRGPAATTEQSPARQGAGPRGVKRTDSRRPKASPRLSEQIGKLTKRLDLCHAFVILTGDIFKVPYKPSSTTD